jgi:superfamily II DNA or RNA helicase
VLVVPPAGLIGNWQREMRTLFRIQARIIRGSETAKGNPFLEPDADFAIVSLDTLRSKGTFARLREAGLAGHGYDLVVFDEAHKLSADRDPIDMTVRKSARYRMAEALAVGNATHCRRRWPCLAVDHARGVGRRSYPCRSGL